MAIQNQLKKLHKTALVHLVSELYGIYGDIDAIVERHLEMASEEKDALYTVIKNQLLQIEQDTVFVDYYASSGYAARLESLLMDIDTLLREQNPLQALQATEQFLWLQEAVLGRADDSNGEIGDVFRDAVDQWLAIAAEVRAVDRGAQDWADKVLTLFNHNDYGVFDDIISHSAELLSEAELTQLAWRFEAQAKKALSKTTKKNGYNSEAAHALIGLRCVAEAQNHMALFEKSFLMDNPDPNSLQLEQIVAFALGIRDIERARYWLENPVWQQDPQRFKTLRNQLLSVQGDTKALKQHLREDFQQEPNAISLENYWKVANKTEKKAVYRHMSQLVEESNDPEDAIEMALLVEHSDLAENLLIKHHHRLIDSYYGLLLHWLESFDNKTHPLACIICYRCLLTSLLERGYRKAYHHGATYFQQLRKLDKAISHYQGLENAQDYIATLQQKHWRKRSFWAQADYPNKPA